MTTQRDVSESLDDATTRRYTQEQWTKDIYVKSASTMFNVPVSEVTPAQRKQARNLVLARVWGARGKETR